MNSGLVPSAEAALRDRSDRRSVPYRRTATGEERWTAATPSGPAARRIRLAAVGPAMEPAIAAPLPSDSDENCVAGAAAQGARPWSVIRVTVVHHAHRERLVRQQDCDTAADEIHDHADNG